MQLVEILGDIGTPQNWWSQKKHFPYVILNNIRLEWEQGWPPAYKVSYSDYD